MFAQTEPVYTLESNLNSRVVKIKREIQTHVFVNAFFYDYSL